MALFTSTEQPARRGRKKGSKNKRGAISEALQKDAITKLEAAVLQGKPWAIQAVIDRTMPKLKAITPTDSLDGEMLAAKIKEVAEFEARLLALETGRDES